VPAFLFFNALGMGVPFVFRGRPRRRGVAMGSAAGSSSMDSFSGTIVVVAAWPRRVLGNGLLDGKSLRRVPLVVSPSSVSTVTNSLWGDWLSPTSSSNVCFLGEAYLADRWLRVTRCEDGGTIMEVSLSLRGSGEDMMSTLGVA